MIFIVQWYGNNRSEWSQHSLLNMDAYLISFNGTFNVSIQKNHLFFHSHLLRLLIAEQGRWRVNKTECHAYLDGLGFVFYMIELNTHDWIAFPLRFCIFYNTTTTTTRASYFRMSTVFIFCYSMLFCKSN